MLLARSTSREIMEPYLGRVHEALDPRRETTAPRREGAPKAKWCEKDGILLAGVKRKDQPTLLGFALLFAVLQSFPIVGPVVGALWAQAAVAHVVAPMLTDYSRVKEAGSVVQ